MLQLKPGERLGNWEVAVVLGGGGTSEGYIVTRPDAGRRFAKVFTDHTELDKRLRPDRWAEFTFFQNELRVRSERFAGLGASVLETFTHRMHFVKIMQVLEGEELTKRLARYRAGRLEGSAAPRSAIATAFVDALATSHKLGVANLDLKPDNAFVFDLPNATAVRLIDFDMGWIDCDGPAPGRRFRRSAYGCTPGYIPPEYYWWVAANEKRQAAVRAGKRPPEIRIFPEFAADVFQAGLVLFDIFTLKSMMGELKGEEPGLLLAKEARRRHFSGVLKSVSAYPTGLSAATTKAVSALADRMLALSPVQRPTMKAAADGLRQALQTSVPPPVPTPPAPTVAVRVQRGGKEVAALERREGHMVALDARVTGLSGQKSAVGSLRWRGGGAELMVNASGLSLNGRALAPGIGSHAVKIGDRITYQGVELRLV